MLEIAVEQEQEIESAAQAESRWLLPVYAQMAVEPVAGRGVELTTRDGRTFLDFYGGHAVALLGYRHPRLLEALGHQAAELFFQSNVAPLAVRARAAKRLVKFAPAGLVRAFLVNSGAEANENALRLAIRATGRTRIVALEGSFHGRTAAAGAVTWGSEKWAGFPYKPFDVTFVPKGDLDALDRALIVGDVAAVILEPVQGMAGAVDLGVEYLRAVRDLTAKHEVKLIFDEVQCGMGRTGFPFAAQRADVLPDLLTTAKGLAGGFPAGALLVTEEIGKIVKTGDLGTTFGGGPMACALIEATIAAIEDEQLLEKVRTQSARLIEGVLAAAPSLVTEVHGAGYLLGLRTTQPAKAVLAELAQEGILAGGSSDPYVVRLLPPLVLEAAHVDALIAALARIAGRLSDPVAERRP